MKTESITLNYSKNQVLTCDVNYLAVKQCEPKGEPNIKYFEGYMLDNYIVFPTGKSITTPPVGSLSDSEEQITIYQVYIPYKQAKVSLTLEAVLTLRKIITVTDLHCNQSKINGLPVTPNTSKLITLKHNYVPVIPYKLVVPTNKELITSKGTATMMADRMLHMKAKDAVNPDSPEVDFDAMTDYFLRKDPFNEEQDILVYVFNLYKL